MKYRVIDEWRLPHGIYILYLDNAKIVTSADNDYRNYRIDGVLYKPISMSNLDGRFIAVEGTSSFIGKEVEFV